MKNIKLLVNSLGKLKTKDPVKKNFWTFINVQKEKVGRETFQKVYQKSH